MNFGKEIEMGGDKHDTSDTEDTCNETNVCFGSNGEADENEALHTRGEDEGEQLHLNLKGDNAHQGRSWGLDLMRLLACICVVFAHTSKDLFSGQHAVAWFFVLSGYVLSLSRTDTCISKLFVSRFIRLMGPTYGIALMQFFVSWPIPTQTPDYSIHILYDAPKIMTLQTGVANFKPFNPVTWTIAYEVYATVLVFITRKLYNAHGPKALVIMFILACISEYADFAPIVLGVCMTEGNLVYSPTMYFKVSVVVSFIVLFIMHMLYDLSNKNHDIIVIKHVAAPLVACGALSVFANLEVYCTTMNRRVNQCWHGVVCQSARLTFMMYLLHFPEFVLFRELFDHNLPCTISELLCGPGALTYWTIFWPTLVITSIIGCKCIDEPCIGLATWYKTTRQ